MEMVRNGHQGEEAYFRIICAIRVERRDKGSALFHIKISIRGSEVS